MRKLIALVTGLAVSAGLAACGDKGAGGGGGGSSSPVGTWVIDGDALKGALEPKVKEQVEQQKKQMEGMPAEQRAMMEKMMPGMDKMLEGMMEMFGKMRVELTLKDGGAMDFSAEMPGEKAEVGKGTWKLEGENIVTKLTEKNGKPAEEKDQKDAPPLKWKGGKVVIEDKEMVIPLKRK